MQQQNLSPWWKMIFNYTQLIPLPLRVGKKKSHSECGVYNMKDTFVSRLLSL